MTTIREVADRAGVSVKTVSRVLSQQPGVRAETRTRIEQVMAEMEYFPSAAARKLRGQGTGTIALIADVFTTAPDAFDIVRGVQSVCRARGKILMVGDSGGEDDVFEKVAAEFRRHRPEAIIRATAAHREVRIEQPFSNTPLVLVNCYERELRYATVLPDDFEGAYGVAVSLLARGHRRIAQVGLQPAMPGSVLRLDGFRRAHEAYGVPVDGSLVQSGVTSDAADEFLELPETLGRMMNAASPPTAIMFGSDKMALRGMMVLRDLGLRVPEDVSVVGYGDCPKIASNVSPKLTTAAVPYFEMGVKATQVALDQSEAQRCLLPCPVVQRDSVRSLPPRDAA